MSKQIATMTTRKFAEAMGINYRTALNWLEAGLVPGATREVSPVGEYWAVPESALKMERPRQGRPKAIETNGATTDAAPGPTKKAPARVRSAAKMTVKKKTTVSN